MDWRGARGHASSNFSTYFCSGVLLSYCSHLGWASCREIAKNVPDFNLAAGSRQPATWIAAGSWRVEVIGGVAVSSTIVIGVQTPPNVLAIIKDQALIRIKILVHSFRLVCGHRSYQPSAGCSTLRSTRSTVRVLSP